MNHASSQLGKSDQNIAVYLDTTPGVLRVLDLTSVVGSGRSNQPHFGVECLERGPIAVATSRDAVQNTFTHLKENLRGWWDASNVDGMGGVDIPHGAPVERWVDLSCAGFSDPKCRDLSNPGG
jgi:hypothetical protein